MIEPLDDAALLNALQDQQRASDEFYASDIAEAQATALAFYHSEPFGDEVDGKSQIILPDVQDTIDYMVQQCIKPFVAGDTVVEFEARDDDQQELADQALAAVSTMFHRGQDGFRVLHDWLKAGLRERFCAVKTTLEIDRKVIVERLLVDADQLAMADEQTAATATDNGDGTFTVEVRREVAVPKFIDYTLPAEEFRFTPDARSEDSAPYLAHVARKTRSELVKMGFDVEQVYDLPGGSDDLAYDVRASERDRHRTTHDALNASMQTVELREEHIQIDADGDGIAERVQAFRVGSQLLSADVVNDQPFVVFSPFPEPHRMVGLGLADKAMTSQRIRSVIARQMLDGIYQTTEPRYWLPSESMTDETIDDLLHGIGPVRGRGMAPTMLGRDFDVSKPLTLLEFFSREREVRTGITDVNQGLAPDILNTTATGAKLQHEQGQQTEQFIVRVFAEALGRLFVKKLRLLKESGEILTVKIDGKSTQVDPATWPDEVDVLVRVGVGTNDKSHRNAQRMQLLEIQREAMQIGMVKPEHLYKTVSGIVRDAGFGQPDDYFLPPDDIEQGEQQPDPAAIEAQGKMQLEMAKLELQRAKDQAEQDRADRRLAWEIDLAERKMQAEMQLALMNAGGMGDIRPGGSLAE